MPPPPELSPQAPPLTAWGEAARSLFRRIKFDFTLVVGQGFACGLPASVWGNDSFCWMLILQSEVSPPRRLVGRGLEHIPQNVLGVSQQACALGEIRKQT